MSHRADTAVPVPSERHVLPGSKNFKCALADGSLYLFIDLNRTIGLSSTGKSTLMAHSSPRPACMVRKELGFQNFCWSWARAWAVLPGKHPLSSQDVQLGANFEPKVVQDFLVCVIPSQAPVSYLSQTPSKFDDT